MANKLQFKKPFRTNTGKKPSNYTNSLRESFFKELNSQKEPEKPRKLIPLEEWKKRQLDK